MRAPSSVATGRVNLNSTTATQIVPQRLSRVRILLEPGSQIIVGDADVTVSTGYPVSGVADWETAAELWALSGAPTETVLFIEFYD